MAFYQKYRPQTFSDIVGEDHIAETLKEAVKSNKLSHAYLLCGPRGTGKTSTARLLAKAFNCQKINLSKESKSPLDEPCNQCEICQEITEGRAIDVIEIDAASHTKVDEIREVIEKVRLLPVRGKKKVYIIDEVHMLSNSSFNALLKTLEEPPSHVAFILATTEPHKLPATILSRTQRFDFRRVKKSDIVKNLKKIAEKEKIDIDNESLELIAIASDGGHRDAVSLLEQISSSSKKITVLETQNILGIRDGEGVIQIVGAIFNAIPEEGLKIAHRFFDGGVDMVWLNKSIIELMRKILIFKATEKTLFEDTEENITEIKKLSKIVSIDDLVRRIENFIKCGQLLKDISYPILPIEMAIIESCGLNKDIDCEIKKEVDNKITNQKQEIEKELKKEIKKDVEKEGNDLETQSVAVFEMTDDIWQKVVEETKKKNSTLAALLRDAKPLICNEKEVVLGVKFAFHKDKISEAKNKKYLEEILSLLLGSKKVVSCQITAEKKETKKPLSDNELQKAAEEVFG